MRRLVPLAPLAALALLVALPAAAQTELVVWHAYRAEEKAALEAVKTSQVAGPGGELPTFVNALPGKGVHLVTVNDYLAKRDAEWTRPVYEKLGVSDRAAAVAVAMRRGLLE